MAKKNKGARVIKIVFRFIGLAFLVGGGVLVFITYDFMDNALPATGSVVSVEVNYGDDSVTYNLRYGMLIMLAENNVARRSCRPLAIILMSVVR